ncbi:YesL family protein [Microbacterium sp. NPDC057650]|uniref:YesL family protein n=1 Tax=unclassified Microbacterium TaxID=2609290 RepID=UPI00366CEC8A
MSVGWAGRVMRMLGFITTLVAVNLLVIAGAAVGLIVLGLFPALVAGGTVLLLGPGERGVLRTFLGVYRAKFRRANVVGAPFLIAGVLLLADAMVLPRLAGPAGAVLLVVTGLIAAAVLVVASVAVALLVRYDDPAPLVLRHAVLVAAGSPGAALAVVVTAVAITAVGLTVPVLLPLVGISLPLLLVIKVFDRRLMSLDPGHPLLAS